MQAAVQHFAHEHSERGFVEVCSYASQWMCSVAGRYPPKIRPGALAYFSFQYCKRLIQSAARASCRIRNEAFPPVFSTQTMDYDGRISHLGRCQDYELYSPLHEPIIMNTMPASNIDNIAAFLRMFFSLNTMAPNTKVTMTEHLRIIEMIESNAPSCLSAKK